MTDRSKNLTPWKPGVSGNPGGRPKAKAVSEEIKLLLAQEAPSAGGKTWTEVVALAIVKKASKGDVRAFAELMNRAEGKATQTVELAGTVNIAERIAEGRARVVKMRDAEAKSAAQSAAR